MEIYGGWGDWTCLAERKSRIVSWRAAKHPSPSRLDALAGW